MFITLFRMLLHSPGYIHTSKVTYIMLHAKYDYRPIRERYGLTVLSCYSLHGLYLCVHIQYIPAAAFPISSCVRSYRGGGGCLLA